MDVQESLHIMCASALSLAAILGCFSYFLPTANTTKTLHFSPNQPCVFCFPDIIVPFIPCANLSIHHPVTNAGSIDCGGGHTLSAPPFPSPASISPAAAQALSPVDGSRHSLTEPPCSLRSFHPSPYSTRRSGEERPNRERSPPYAIITPTHDFVGVSFVEFVFLFA